MVSFSWCFGGSKKKVSKEWREIEALRTKEAERLEKSFSCNAPDNTLMMQAFEWHVPDDKCHWNRLRNALPDLKAIGIDSLWIPPGCKAMRPSDNGYETYDLYDLGEFDQKGSRATKWGSREELDALTAFAEDIGVGIYWDAILNHKAGADYTERFEAVKVDPQDRNLEISVPEDIESWVGFDFRGRGNVYSSMKYGWHHFSGVDWDVLKKKNAIYKIVGDDKRKQWAQGVSDENGNFDYLMFANLDYSNPEVKEDALRWGHWISTQLRLSGMRLDAIKHYPTSFQKEFIDHLRDTIGRNFSFIGEYWTGEPRPLLEYLAKMDYRLSLFDVPLLVRFSKISQTQGGDLREIFDGTLVDHKPQNAITFVANHDTVRNAEIWFWKDYANLSQKKQPLQTLETTIAPFFKPLAYSLILLRKDGQPCVFYGDLYGIKGGTKRQQPPSCGGKLSRLTLARKLYAYGAQQDYFDTANCVGFVRYGNLRHPNGLACVLSNASAAKKLMYVGKEHAGERWTDILSWREEKITINKRGYGSFPVSKMSVSVWVNSAAEGRDAFRQQFNDKIYEY